MRKIPKRYSGIVLGGLMAIIMGAVVSFVVTLTNLGVPPDFFARWMVAFGATLPVNFPVALVVTPIVKVFVDRMSA
jgi:hypothetical protein